MIRHSYRYQRTLARPAQIHGVGFLTGEPVGLRFVPAPPATGILFHRVDLGPDAIIPALVDQVTGTHRRTTLGHAPLQVSLVEHVLAALAGLKIDNCVVEIDGPEPPGLDGSALGFIRALEEASCTLQPGRRPVWTVTAPLTVAHGGATLTLHPGDPNHLRASYILDYGLDSALGWQIHTETITPERFVNRIADSRTFLLEEEALALRRQGLGLRTSPADLLVYGKHGPIENRTRYGNEPARHKILDLLGDLSLLGADLRGHVVAYRSGHPLNVELVRMMRRSLVQPKELCWRKAA